MTLRVLAPGLHTLVVDFGRPNYRSLGVPVGGAADRFSLALGNALVGNPPDAAALEVTLAGPTLQAEAQLACVLYGAPFQISSDRQELVLGRTFTLEPGEAIQIGSTANGMRAYLCVRGGLGSRRILGSLSGLQPIRSEERLPCPTGAISHRFVSLIPSWKLEARTIRVGDGPQADWFDMKEFYSQEFLVTPASNRMGLRLLGRALKLPARELVSEPVCPGSVQVSREGQCIVLGIDGQTIGGYPKIAQVIGADLDILGQLRPDDRFRFVKVDLGEAEALYRVNRQHLHEWTTRLQSAELFS
jgi:antagonist of KipI